MAERSSTVVVSVIIVSWNARDYLMECLDSLVKEKPPYAMEIIVVDNASSDGSPDWVQSRYPQARLIRNQANLGFAKANNIGIAQSAGKYLCLVNSDVKVFKGCIEALIEYCERHGEVGVAGPRLIGRDGKLQRSCRGFPSLWNTFCRALALDTLFPKARLFTTYSLTHWPQENLKEVDILSGCFWLVRREALDGVGLLDESFFMYGEDMDWCRRFWDAGWKLVYLPAAGAQHYGGASSSNAPLRFHVEMNKADLRYWKKHHSPIAVGFYLILNSLHPILRLAGYSMVLAVSRPRGEKRDIYRYKVKRSLAHLAWLFTGHSHAQMAC